MSEIIKFFNWLEKLSQDPENIDSYQLTGEEAKKLLEEMQETDNMMA